MITAESILAEFKAKKYRLTPFRTWLVGYFVATHEPVTVRDILVSAKKARKAVNKTTVYRELDFLMGEGIVESVDLGAEDLHYELLTGHHHHLICEECGYAEHIEVAKLEPALALAGRNLGNKFKFEDISHHLNFTGLCQDCAKPGRRK